MPPTWPHSTIRELLTLAQTCGQSEAELNSEPEAKSFRFAIYYFRRKNPEFGDLSITMDKTKVIVVKRPQAEVTISAPSSSEDFN